MQQENAVLTRLDLFNNFEITTTMQHNRLTSNLATGTPMLLATVVGPGVMAQCVFAVLATVAVGWLVHPRGYPEVGHAAQKRQLQRSNGHPTTIPEPRRFTKLSPTRHFVFTLIP
ncbi:MAG: hypothetical protein HQ504_13660 [Rhodospirillaceae bacterium]|nr:hypothetical protein [Rhodospirillaceae bacterium]